MAYVNLDSSDPVNSVVERVLDTLGHFATADEDWEHPLFVKGFPALNPEEILPRPVIAVYSYASECLDIGYDNVLGTNGLQPSDAGYVELHGVEFLIDCYLEIYTTKPTAKNPMQTGGGNLASRISGKIQSRLRGHTECLGPELEVLRIRDEGIFEPLDSNKPQILFRRLDLQLSVCFELEIAA